MRKYLKELKRKKRKANHVMFLHQVITELHKEIVIATLNDKVAKNKAKLLRKYNRRLMLISY